MAIAFPDIDPVALAIGPLEIRWYALAYLAGFLLGVRYCCKLAAYYNGEKPDKNDMDDFLGWAVAGVILGGRLGYVLFYQPQYYLNNPTEILMLWQGGMSFHGGVLGVAIAMAWFAHRRKIKILRLSDLVCAAAPIGIFFGRLANFINAELYGRATDMPWGVVFPTSGDGLARHPSQLYEAFLEGGLLFIILYVLIRKFKALNHAGTVSGVFLLLYGIFRGFIEFFREPDAHLGLLGGFISMGQILCLPMIIGGVLLIIMAQKQQSKEDERQSAPSQNHSG